MKDPLDALLDKAMRERAGELPFLEDIPLPNVQDALAAFRASALGDGNARRKKAPRYRAYLRAAAAVVLLLGLGIGIYAGLDMLRGTRAPLSSSAPGEAEPMALAQGVNFSAEWLAMADAVAEGDAEATYFDSLERIHEYFDRVPVLSGGVIDSAEMVTLTEYASADAPMRYTAEYTYWMGDLKMRLFCVRSAGMAATIAEDMRSVDAFSLDALSLPAYMTTTQDSISAVWSDGAESVYLAALNTDSEETAKKFLSRLEWMEL